MILGLRHVGIVVSNLEASLHFYVSLLGLKIDNRADEAGQHLDDVLRLKAVNVTTVKLRVPGGPLIELLYFNSHRRFPNLKRELCAIGITHISITVDDLEAEYRMLSRAGVVFTSLPRLAPGEKVRLAFCMDPDQNAVELVEELTC